MCPVTIFFYLIEECVHSLFCWPFASFGSIGINCLSLGHTVALGTALKSSWCPTPGNIHRRPEERSLSVMLGTAVVPLSERLSSEYSPDTEARKPPSMVCGFVQGPPESHGVVFISVHNSRH